MKKYNYSESIANAINNYLTDEKWHFDFNEQLGVFNFGLYISGIIKKIDFIIDVNEDYYTVYAICPVGVDENDEEAKARMAEYICRVNYRIKNGLFELDMDDGEIRFRNFVDCEDVVLTSDIVKNSIACPAVMFKHYSSGIADMIFGKAKASDAVELSEKPKRNIGDILNTALMLEEDKEDGDVVARLREMAEDEDELKEELYELIDILDDHDEADDDNETEIAFKTDLFGKKAEGEQ